MNFAQFDLNLLRVFLALDCERSVSRAGKRLGLSQPAVSAALNRLRYAFGDQLYVREGREMLPTRRARKLLGPISDALATLEHGLSGELTGAPDLMKRSFSLLGADFFSMLFMPALAARIASEAPNVRLRLFDSARGDVERLLVDGVVDLALEHAPRVNGVISSQPLFDSVFVLVMRRDHPLLAQRSPDEALVRDDLTHLDLAVYSLDGGESGCAVEFLHAEGLGENIALALPHFYATGLSAAGSDHAALLPCQFAEALAEPLGLAIRRLPIPAPRLTLGMYWHTRHDEDRQHVWFRRHVRDLVADLGFQACADRYAF
ncbi:MAG: LysR family transcriptional regulator [Salinarimonas sp.]|nr:LysR family transcriptional regulator [Salinarimonas sp.]